MSRRYSVISLVCSRHVPMLVGLEKFSGNVLLGSLMLASVASPVKALWPSLVTWVEPKNLALAVAPVSFAMLLFSVLADYGRRVNPQDIPEP